MTILVLDDEDVIPSRGAEEERMRSLRLRTDGVWMQRGKRNPGFLGH